MKIKTNLFIFEMTQRNRYQNTNRKTKKQKNDVQTSIRTTISKIKIFDFCVLSLNYLNDDK